MSEASVDGAVGGGPDASSAWSTLADQGWRATERTVIHGWQARFACGVTKRANSAWAARAGAAVVSTDAIAAVEAEYHARRISPCFQVSTRDELASRLLIGRGYRPVDETLVLAASVSPSLSPPAPLPPSLTVPAAPSPTASPAVEIAGAPSDEWLACWWSVDGRGGDAELDVARSILTGTPSLYASLRVDERVVSVARLALVGSWGGLYCVSTLPEHRRRGYSARVIESLLAVAADGCEITDVWLQVLAGNSGAIALYSGRFGFREVDRYRYFIAR